MHSGGPRVADYLVESLAALGVRHVFGVGGANIEDLYDAAHHSGRLTPVVAKHEFAAACMAEGSHRTGGGLGVVMTTSGAGAMNLVPGVSEAYAARVPLLALVGQPPRPLEGRGAFQDSSGLSGSLDAVQLFGSISRFCARIDDPADAGELLAAAVDATRGPRGGPAVLLLPKDVQQAAAEGLLPVRDLLPVREEPAAVLRGAAAELLTTEAARGADVVLVAGDGVAHQDARAELARLAALLDATVAVTPEGKDAFDNHDPRFLGVTGAIGHPTVLRGIEKAAVCVLVGTRLPVMARAGLDVALADTPLVAYDPEPPFPEPRPGGRPALHVDGCLRTELHALNEALAALPERPAACAAEGPEHLLLPDTGTSGVRLVDAVRAIEAAVPEDATVVSDAGNASAAAIHYLATPRRGNYVIAMGMGGMGHSFGAGIGAAFATGRRTYVLSGDGGFYAHGMELHTAVEYGLPVTFVIFDNNAHGMCVTREQLFYEGTYSYNSFKPADIAAGARAMFPSLTAVEAHTAEQLRETLLDTNETAGPALIGVRCDPDDMPPFTPFLHLLNARNTHTSGAPHGHPAPPVG
ncbi:thiamine pyrophosphate-binding protein [Streptomyces sp. DSM 42041]|uniref:Thiamine pyrophosphate-binding protein n=1 Tax=Streptomyces hazeniae TaxID=3075538 RepID=A0ABU2NNU8_9ACTN|nr:thiamine pyrophosphate-binding protein [Streptomyces sp. DSM 42041]MDT0377717.1 thiamine pyrophosphate-binding protein [Streptomyces sp. DSM 42041]